MSLPPKDSGVSDSAVVGGKDGNDWADVVPKSVGSEDALDYEENKNVWEKIYRKAGMGSASEKERRALRAAIYVYCAKNGTSREGNYEANMVLSNGKIISSAVIPQSAGRMKIRKFLRANMKESYEFFKKTRVMEAEERFVAKCATFGISAENAFATADWLADCPYFTPVELRAHQSTFDVGVERARRARDGRSLEAVESGRVKDSLQVQGPSADRGSVIEF